MNEFWTLFKESVILQAIITLVILATVCAMYVTRQTVPENLWSALMLILGFYFGSKVENVKASKLR